MTISDWMTLRRVTQLEVAERLGITTQAFRNKLRKENSPGFFLGEVQDLRALLGISIGECIEAIAKEQKEAETLLKSKNEAK